MVRRSMLAVALLMWAPSPLPAQPPVQPTFRIVETDPEGRTTLGRREPLYLRIAYESGTPLRFQAAASRDGAPVERGAAFNPAPVYPAGAGEALAWIAFDNQTRIDAVRVVAMDARWGEIAAETRTVDVQWDPAGAPRGRTPAAWVRRLSDAQQAMASQAIAASVETGGSGDLVVWLMGLSVPAYLALQVVLLALFRGGWRKAAMVPLLGMIPLGLYTLAGLVMGSNLWPLMLLFLTPGALTYLLALGLVRAIVATLSR